MALGGVAAKVRAHLVDLVDHEHGVARARVAQGADDRPRHRADIGAPVAADLRLVADPADRDALELAPERLRDRPAEAGLPHPRAARRSRGSGPCELRVQLAHRQVLEDAVLDLLQVVVIGVEDLARVGDVKVVLGGAAPRQLDQPLEIGADDAVLGGRRRQALQAPQLAIGLLSGVLGEVRRLDPLAQLVDLGLLLVGLAQLLLDRLQLLAQVVLALALVDLRLDLRLDLGAELDHLQLAGEDLGEAAQPLRRRPPPRAAPASPRWRSAARPAIRWASAEGSSTLVTASWSSSGR